MLDAEQGLAAAAAAAAGVAVAVRGWEGPAAAGEQIFWPAALQFPRQDLFHRVQVPLALMISKGGAGAHSLLWRCPVLPSPHRSQSQG